MAESFRPATTITEAFNAVNPNLALAANDGRYVDFTEWRGTFPVADQIVTTVARSAQSELASERHVKVLFTGHKGSGKSTELNQVASQLRKQGFFVVFLDAAAELDLAGDTHTRTCCSL